MAPAFIAHVQVSFFLGEPVPMLQNSLGSFDEFARFKGLLHFQCFRHKSSVFQRERGLAGDGFGKSHFFFCEWPARAEVNVERSNDSTSRSQRDRKKRTQSSFPGNFPILIILLGNDVIDHHHLPFANNPPDEGIFNSKRHAVHELRR